MEKFLLILFLILSNMYLCYSQDIHFSQFNNVPLLINPALTGECQGGRGRVIVNYRDQWKSISENSYKTYSISGDYAFFNNKLSTGLFIFKDKAGNGDMSLSQVNLSIASKVKINKNNFIKIGLQAAWSQRNIDMSKLTWNSQYDGKTINPDLSSGEAPFQGSNNYFSINTGALYTHQMSNKSKFNVGLSVSNLNRPQYDFIANEEKLELRWCVHTDFSIPIHQKNIIILPSAYATMQGLQREVNAGIAIKYDHGLNSKYTGSMKSSGIFLGTYYRLGDALIVFSRFEFRRQYSICLSYDLNFSRLSLASNTRGGVEITLLYDITEAPIRNLK